MLEVYCVFSTRGSGSKSHTCTIIKCMTFTALSESGEYRHQLTVDELANHSHQTSYEYGTNLVATNGGGAGWTHYTCNTGSRGVNGTGGNQPHNNMPPSKAVYYWHRIS